MKDCQEVAPGLYWGNVYWVRGELPTKDRRMTNEVKDPPTSGWGHAFLIDKGGKLVTLFSPFSLDAYQVTRNSLEVAGMERARDPFDRDRAVGHILKTWEMVSNFGWMKKYDEAAMVLQMLGAEVPLRTTTQVEGEQPEARGGKEADALGLLKPVKRAGRRGQVLSFFLSGPRSAREAMAEFGVTRSNLLSQLYLLQKDHGIGYQLVGDAVSVTLPAGCDDPFEPEAVKEAA